VDFDILKKHVRKTRIVDSSKKDKRSLRIWMRLVKTLLEDDERWEEMTPINESERLFYIIIIYENERSFGLPLSHIPSKNLTPVILQITFCHLFNITTRKKTEMR
jgi:hypothetical protein